MAYVFTAGPRLGIYGGVLGETDSPSRFIS